MAEQDVNKVNDKVSNWERKLKEHREKQLINPFSEWQGASHRAKLSRQDEDYGKPVQGSGTEKRGKQANQLVSSEIITLLKIIRESGTIDCNTNSACITFDCLFQLYTRISNKVVGMLLRARKHGLVSFEGEMLFQGRDENVKIWLTDQGQEAIQ